VLCVSKNKKQNLRTIKIKTCTNDVQTTSEYKINPPDGCDIPRIRPDPPWGPPNILCNRYRIFPGVNQLGRGVNNAPSSSAEVKERVELFLYSLSEPS
jgi:hypothetical protein